MPWIPVTECLPSPQRHVIAFCPAYDKYYRWKLAEIRIVGTEPVWHEALSHKEIDVTHWADIPSDVPDPLPPRNMLEVAQRMALLEDRAADCTAMSEDESEAQKLYDEAESLASFLKTIPVDVMRRLETAERMLAVHGPGADEDQ